MDILVEPSRRKASFLIRDILGDTGSASVLKPSAHVIGEAINNCQKFEHRNRTPTPGIQGLDKAQSKDLEICPESMDLVVRNPPSDLLGRSLHNILDRESQFFQNIFKQRLFLQGKERLGKDQYETRGVNSSDIELKRNNSFPMQQELIPKLDGIRGSANKKNDLTFEPRVIKRTELEKDEDVSTGIPNAARNTSPESRFSYATDSKDMPGNFEYGPYFSIGTERQEFTGNYKQEDSWSKDTSKNFERADFQHHNIGRKGEEQIWTAAERSSSNYNAPRTASISPDICTSTSPAQHPSTPSPTASLSPPSPKTAVYTSFPAFFARHLEAAENTEGKDFARHSKHPARGFEPRETSGLPGAGPARPLPNPPQPLTCVRPTVLPPMFPFRVTQHQGLHPGLTQPVTSTNRPHHLPGHLPPGHPCLGFPHLSSAGFLSRGENIQVLIPVLDEAIFFLYLLYSPFLTKTICLLISSLFLYYFLRR